MNKTDLSHCGQQHICVISGRHHKGYRPHADAAIKALGPLRRVALSFDSNDIIPIHAVALKR